ncbi:MAG: amidohydrolase [Desulfofustis sp.]|nr:amidohydrolase [Desulfofustis sp.]
MDGKHDQADYIVSGRYLLPTWRHADRIEDGAVAVLGDAIAAIGSRAELTARFPEAEQLHEPAGLVMPGLINTHTHAPMSYLRGIADDLPLMTWLQEHIFPVEQQLDAEMVYLSTLLSIAEMIKSGTTSFCDMYLFAGEVARAADETGIRAWIGEVLYDFDSPSYGKLDNGFAMVRELVSAYRQHPLISITVAPHSVYTCAPTLLERAAELAANGGCLHVVHLAETESEVATCVERYGVRPVQHLHRLGLLESRLLAAHCVHLTEEEMDLLASTQVKVSHCVESNMKLASGAAPIPALIQKGVCVTIGTDGPASNNDVDMFAEMSSVAKVHKVVAMDPTVMDAETTLKCATFNGAMALGAESEIGTLETGKKADLIVLDLDQPHLVPLYNLPSHLVYAARGGDVIHSMINGRLVMKQRHLLSLDEDMAIARMQELSTKVLRIREQAGAAK